MKGKLNPQKPGRVDITGPCREHRSVVARGRRLAPKKKQLLLGESVESEKAAETSGIGGAPTKALATITESRVSDLGILIGQKILNVIY